MWKFHNPNQGFRRHIHGFQTFKLRLQMNSNQESDLAQMERVGYCRGVENYARHLSGRQKGEPPDCCETRARVWPACVRKKRVRHARMRALCVVYMYIVLHACNFV
jgi:hypothetical protein